MKKLLLLLGMAVLLRVFPCLYAVEVGEMYQMKKEYHGLSAFEKVKVGDVLTVNVVRSVFESYRVAKLTINRSIEEIVTSEDSINYLANTGFLVKTEIP